MNRFAGWTAVVTGASAGLGVEFARQLAPSVSRLVLVARRRDRLETLAAELRTAHPTLAVEVEPADLSKPLELAALAFWLREEKIDLLVNNAGLGDMGIFESSAWPRDEAMLRVNVDALTHLTHALLPGMIARRRGAVVNVGSVAGYLPIPTFAVYAATKAYVNSFSEALFWELHGTGVTVTAVCPGPVPTEFFEVAGRKGDGTNGRAMGSPDLVRITAVQAVAEALRASEAGKPRIVPGGWMRFGVWWLSRLPLAALRLGFRIGIPGKVQAQRQAAGKQPV